MDWKVEQVKERGYRQVTEKEIKQVLEKWKFLAQSFQKVGILFLLEEPPASPRGCRQTERQKESLNDRLKNRNIQTKNLSLCLCVCSS